MRQDGAALAVRKWHLNEAFCTGRLAPLASVYVPLAPPSRAAAAPHHHFSPDSAFESSGVLAAALDTATMPYRLQRTANPTGLGPATGMPPTLCECSTTLHLPLLILASSACVLQCVDNIHGAGRTLFPLQLSMSRLNMLACHIRSAHHVGHGCVADPGGPRKFGSHQHCTAGAAAAGRRSCRRCGFRFSLRYCLV